MRVELGRLIPGHTQRLPLAGFEMLGQIDDLTYMISVVRKLTIDGLHNRVILSANSNRSHEVCRRKRLDGNERAFPTFLPISHQVFSGRVGQHDEFHVAISFGFFSVRCQKIGPAREHVAGHVFYDDRDAVRFVIDRAEEIFIADLRESPFRELLIIAKSVQRVVQIVLAN